MSVMQFHLNGFVPGDPHDLHLRHENRSRTGNDSSVEEVDVLIIGSGPAGLALAAQLSLFSNIKTRLIEQKSSRLTLGQADGLQCRTIEMFEAYGFSERVLKEAYWVNETTFWKPDEDQPENIVRSGRIRDTEEGLSEFPHVILNQARIHDFFLDVMQRSPTKLLPTYSRRLANLKLHSTSKNPYVDVELERTEPGHEGEIEKVRARYVVGCEGARSSVREALGLQLKGDSANQAWGVMDVLAVSDFPDYRTKAAIHSAEQGSILIIPREGGYLVRFYIELDKLNTDERVASRKITAERLISAAKRILNPYVLDVKEVVWWSVYEIGQRLCNRFDDVPEEERGHRTPHVFIAGDACHTHSPKAGQGMNVGMQDGFNLGWKLASVISGTSSPEIMHTYSAERQAVAKELIDFDREFAKMFSARPKPTARVQGSDKPNSSQEHGTSNAGPAETDAQEQGSDGTIDPAAFQSFFQKQGRFTAGLGTCYMPSLIIAKPLSQHLAQGFTIGERFHSAPVVRLADAKPIQLAHVVKADNRWRIFIFTPSASDSGFRALCKFLAEAPNSPLRRYTPATADLDSVIDVRGVLHQSHKEVEINDVPELLWPRKGRYGIRDYEKVFCAETVDSADDIFGSRQIDRGGCVIVVRPDQYVANVLPLEKHVELAGFFDGFMVARS